MFYMWLLEMCFQLEMNLKVINRRIITLLLCLHIFFLSYQYCSLVKARWRIEIPFYKYIMVPMCTTICSNSSLVLALLIIWTLRMYFCKAGDLSVCLETCSFHAPSSPIPHYIANWDEPHIHHVELDSVTLSWKWRVIQRKI